jgi:hypothetical protein
VEYDDGYLRYYLCRMVRHVVTRLRLSRLEKGVSTSSVVLHRVMFVIICPGGEVVVENES